MKILLTSEHAGFELREALAVHLRSKGFEVETAGAPSTDSVDYPPIAAEAAKRVVDGEFDLGISICGTGIGMAIAASKVPGAIVGCATNAYMARMARAHNNATTLCLGSRVIGRDLAFEIAETFLTTEFEGGRHARRVDQIMAVERDYRTSK